jgi:hypothetical protein
MMEVSRPDWGHTSPDKTEKRMDQCLGGDGIFYPSLHHKIRFLP